MSSAPSYPGYQPFQPADFDFVGYDDLQAELVERLESIGTWDGVPTVTVVDNPVFVPTTKVAATNRTAGRFVYVGGILDAEGQVVTAAQARRRGGRWGVRTIGEVTPEAPRVPTQALDDENIIYMGWFHTPFGHFLLESLARSWYLNQASPETRVLYHPDRIAVASGIIRKMFDAFDLPASRLIIPIAPTKLKRLTIPQPLFELSYAAHVRMGEPFKRVADRLLGPVTRSEQPVYLSRRLLQSHRRQIVGELQLEEVLRENGFLIAHPETMPFVEQVRLFNTHRVFLTSAGSALYGGLWAMQPLEFHVMAAGVPRHDYFLVPRATGASATYINCFGYGNRPNTNTSPLVLDLDRLLGHLANAGLIKETPLSTITRRTYSWHERFDHDWHYTSLRDTPVTQPLPPDLVAQVLPRAETSWPLTLALLLNQPYRSQGNNAEILSQRLARLVREETDSSRLMYYYDDVQGRWTLILNLLSEPTKQALISAFAERYGLDLPSMIARGEQKQREALEQAEPIAGLRYLAAPGAE